MSSGTLKMFHVARREMERKFVLLSQKTLGGMGRKSCANESQHRDSLSVPSFVVIRVLRKIRCIEDCFHVAREVENIF